MNEKIFFLKIFSEALISFYVEALDRTLNRALNRTKSKI